MAKKKFIGEKAKCWQDAYGEQEVIAEVWELEGVQVALELNPHNHHLIIHRIQANGNWSNVCEWHALEKYWVYPIDKRDHDIIRLVIKYFTPYFKHPSPPMPDFRVKGKKR